MSRFGEFLKGGSAAPVPAEPTPEPVVEDVVITPQEEVLREASPLEEMTKSELEEYGRTLGVELDKRHSKKRLIQEIHEVEDDS